MANKNQPENKNVERSNIVYYLPGRSFPKRLLQSVNYLKNINTYHFLIKFYSLKHRGRLLYAFKVGPNSKEL